MQTELEERTLCFLALKKNLENTTQAMQVTRLRMHDRIMIEWFWT